MPIGLFLVVFAFKQKTTYVFALAFLRSFLPSFVPYALTDFGRYWAVRAETFRKDAS